MANFAYIQSKIYYGYGKAALKLGTTHDIFRSADGIDPLKIENYIGQQLFSVDQDLTYMKPRKYGDMVWQFLPQNGTVLQNYDYFLNDTVTYYIADIMPTDRLSPPICVECNATISIYNASTGLSPGINSSYQGFTPSNPNNELVVRNVPVALLLETRSNGKYSVKLPTSVNLPSYSITMPEFDDIFVRTGAYAVDNLGRQFVILNAERTKRSAGLRLIVQELGV